MGWLLFILALAFGSLVAVVFCVGAMAGGLEVVKGLLHHMGW